MKNEAATVDKVHHLLQEREKLASCTARAYTSAATYLTALSIDNMFEVFTVPMYIMHSVNIVDPTATRTGVPPTADVQAKAFPHVSASCESHTALPAVSYTLQC